MLRQRDVKKSSVHDLNMKPGTRPGRSTSVKDRLATLSRSPDGRGTRARSSTSMPGPNMLSIELSLWTPSFLFAFLGLSVLRVIGAVMTGIPDCDETFNFWEPSHYLLYGFGFQTWEYSPMYALRSYFYAGMHSVVGYASSWIIAGDKVTLKRR